MGSNAIDHNKQTRCIVEEQNRYIYLNSGLYQVQPESQCLPHEDVGIVALVKRLL